MRRTVLAACLLYLATMPAACARRPPRLGEGGMNPEAASSRPEESVPLRIAAASDLQKVLPKLADRFRERTGIAATLTLDASGRLAEQIKAGAPYDVFLAANAKFVENLAATGYVDPGSVRPYARGTLVLCIHPSVGDKVKRLADLAGPEIKKIAIANPEYAPYGVAAREALEKAGLWDALAPRIARADSVRQALIHVRNGDAEAGLVGRALADEPEVRRVEVDPALYAPIVQVLGVVSSGSQKSRAGEFASFVLGEEGQKILHEFHFESPPSTR